MTGEISSVWQWLAYVRMNIDILTGNLGSTLYYGTSLVNEYQNASVETGYYINQETAMPEFQLYQTKMDSLYTFPVDARQGEYMEWFDDITFNLQTGLPQILFVHSVPLHDKLASFQIRYYTSIYEVSSFLKSLLTSNNDRLYAFLRNSGILLGTSDGKFFSHSEV